MSARTDTYDLQATLARRGILVTVEQANVLRRAQLTLRRWYEQECGDSNQYASFSIERDETTDIPYRCIYRHDGKVQRYRIPDRERGAKRRVEKLAQELGLHVCYQGDPRGPSLYVSREPFPEFDTSRGVPCC